MQMNKRCLSPLLAVAMLATATAAQATVHRVYPGESIQAAIDGAVPGDTVLVEITQIGKECHNKCAIYYKAGDCIMPREGVFARVLAEGKIRCGDAIKILHKTPASRA